MISILARALRAAVIILMFAGSPAPAQTNWYEQACRLPGQREATGLCASPDCSSCRAPSGVCYRRGVPTRCPPRVLTEADSGSGQTVSTPPRTGEACHLPGSAGLTGICFNGDCSICRNPRSGACYSRSIPVRCPHVLNPVGPAPTQDDGSEK